MRAWDEYERGLDAPRVALRCVVCGAIVAVPLEDAEQDREDGYVCLDCLHPVKPLPVEEADIPW